MTDHLLDQTHQSAVEEILKRVLDDRERVVSVDSPPGAGKSELVIEVADRGTEGGSSDPIGVISQTNEQADDLTIRLAARFASDGRLVGRLHSEKHNPPARVSGPAVRRSQHLHDLAGCEVIVAPAAKWAYTSGSWSLSHKPPP